jgi:EAL domain-containing protein (putative c-di-GMP-specific phosphodiesterase class I)/GGDEF domain-containing protein
VLFVNTEFADYFNLSEKDITKEFLNSLKISSIADPYKKFGFLEGIDRKKHINDVQISGMPNPVPVKINSNLFRESEDGDTFWRVVIMHDMTEHYRLQKQMLKTQSYNDLLTNLPIQGRLISDIVDANLRSNIQETSIVLSFFGIRHFAAQRSILGYEKTNKLIKNISEILKNDLDENEKLYYRGRGDFAILVAESSNPNLNIKRAEEHIHNVQDALLQQNNDIGFSKAIMHLHNDKRSPDSIIDRCHEMQLESERLDRLVTEESDADVDQDYSRLISRAVEKQFGKSDFTNAIQRKEFFSFYQPIFDLKTNELIGAEYLMRWNHPKYGLLNASDFLDKAVKLNVLTEITDYLLENVLSHKSSWDNFGIKDFNLSINFALPELRIVNFAEKLESKLNEHAIDADTITIDLSEKLLNEDMRIIRSEVEILKKLGVQIALDSFGEGFTHLRLLEELPFDTIKIDQSLIKGIDINQDKKKLVSAIVAMGNSLGVTVGATYVDSISVRDTLSELGCDYGQGYYYSKALPFFEMLKFIQGHKNITQ